MLIQMVHVLMQSKKHCVSVQMVVARFTTMWQVTENCTPATGLMLLGVYLIANNLANSSFSHILVVILLFDYDTIKKSSVTAVLYSCIG